MISLVFFPDLWRLSTRRASLARQNPSPRHSMFRSFALRTIFLSSLLLSTSLPRLVAQDAAEAPAPEDEKNKPQVKLICVTALPGEKPVTLAVKDKEDKWIELSRTEIRSSFVTDWLPAQAGPIFLTIKQGDTFRTIGQFQYPAGAKQILVVLLADQEKNIYRASVTNPEELSFRKGSLLIVNFSQTNAVVLLGSKKVTVNAGQKQVAEPALDEKGMYRKVVAYLDADKNPVPCYDRFVPGSSESRDLLFLFPDPTAGLRVFSLPMFGE